MHPARRGCSSLKYSRYSRSSRLASRAHRRPRCNAGLSPRAAQDSRRCATDGVEERVEVRFAGAEIDDARPEHESSLELSASQKHTPLVLHGVEDVPVQSIDIGALSLGRGPMTEAGDAERPGGD